MNKGFTLVELVMVIVLIGILVAVASPRLPSLTGTKAAPFADKLRADIRYAQDLAMTQGMRSRVNFSSTSYAILSSTTTTCTAFVSPTTGGPWTITLNSGAYAGITLSLPAITCLEYDSLGRPYDCTGIGNVCSSALLITAMSVGVNPGGSVSVSAQTGAVN
jgi:prepilin-type N-terminal cleavage/methylation domain-containing protein